MPKKNMSFTLSIAAALIVPGLSIVNYAHSASNAMGISSASYHVAAGSSPDKLYSELVMGPTIRVYNALSVLDTSARAHRIDLPQTAEDGRVFEGLAPMLSDLNGDGLNEVVVTETDQFRGSSLAVYGMRDGQFVKIAQSPFLGKRPQWIAQAGIADFDEDGINEIAVVEKPHGGNVFRIWKLDDNELVSLAEIQGPTNHVEGTNHYRSLLSFCGDTPSVVLSDHEWERIYSLSLSNGKVIKKEVGYYVDRSSIIQAASC